MLATGNAVEAPGGGEPSGPCWSLTSLWTEVYHDHDFHSSGIPVSPSRISRSGLPVSPSRDAAACPASEHQPQPDQEGHNRRYGDPSGRKAHIASADGKVLQSSEL